ncbi:MAG: sulfite exporter TauE/SafE family protein [Candidatus Hydrogenedentes bacterium]|nr:sulfite exporter TauE/SafE family protein [Candidatus Hydrogenedentota bacterium]
MTAWMWTAAGAVWLGILTSVSPCLMATNVAAISFLARKVNRRRDVLLSSAFYVLGQALAFVLLAMLIVTSLVSVPLISHALQKYMFRLLGPILILASMPLLNLLDVNLGSGRLKQWAQTWGSSGGFGAAALLGILFAMSFCPTTAALFFGSLIPLAVANESSLFLPLMYALGVALPATVFSILIAFAAHEIGRVFHKASQMEGWARRFTGAVFLAVGLYFTLAYTLRLF